MLSFLEGLPGSLAVAVPPREYPPKSLYYRIFSFQLIQFSGGRSSGLNQIRLHDLRHTHVFKLIKQGVYSKKIADRVGHSTISTTMDIYGHPMAESQREAAIKFEHVLNLPDTAVYAP